MSKDDGRTIYQAQSSERDKREPKMSIPQAVIDKLVTLDPTDPEYPLKRPFEDYYKAASGEFEAYVVKFAIASALIEDGRYGDLRFLTNAFVSKGTESNDRILALKDLLQTKLHDALLKRGDRKEIKTTEGELKEFLQNVAKGGTLDGQSFRQVIGLFPSSNVVDILYLTRPEFKGLPVERVKGILADYLGDYLLVKGRFNPDDMGRVVDYLSDPKWGELLVEVVKDDCLNFYNQERKKGPIDDDWRVIDTYFEDLSSKVDALENSEIKAVIESARSYYDRALNVIRKPETMVDCLKEGRKFPDLNQLINRIEVAEKRKVLLADEMGLGKSASFIFTKESLGIEQALVIAPSNVIPTWQDYLSDKIGEDGKQIGYFKPGMAPKVLVVEGPGVLENSPTAEYILISQERLNRRYTSLLKNLNVGMLGVDEIHKLKDLQNGVRTASLVEITADMEAEDKYVVLLSGTPVPNKIEDVAIILKLLYPEKFKGIGNKKIVRQIINGDLIDLRSLLIPRMQMKNLAESIEIPELIENLIYLKLSPEEKEIYEVLMDEDEIEAKDKIRILRQFLLNPRLLGLTPDVVSTKTKTVGEYLTKLFGEKDRVVMFVNGYIEDVIRGKDTVFNKMGIPHGVEVKVIEGDVPKSERVKIQSEFGIKGKKSLLAVSGQTADVGVDFSKGQALVFFNEPWSVYTKQQQQGRVRREGSEDALESYTFIIEDTIEEGIHRYIEIKYKAIEKLLRGIPITDLEKELLRKSETQVDPNLEVNPELAEYYFSSWDKMMKIFAHVKEIGQGDFVKFLKDYGKDYAICYADMGSRSYQANACRVSATVIDSLVKGTDKAVDDLRIIDIASGPEMLKKHTTEEYQSRITSLDLNPFHFTGPEGKRIVASFNHLPVADNSFDYANLSLALHYTRFLPGKGDYERLEVLREMNRILKIGGTAVINLMFNLEFRDMEKFEEIAQVLGFQMLGEYSGQIIVEDRYQSRLVTLEKTEDAKSLEEILKNFTDGSKDETLKGLKFQKTDTKLKDSRRIIKEFEIKGRNLKVNFNRMDKKVLEEEEQIISEGEALKRQYRDIGKIPREKVLEGKFVRILIGKQYRLFKKLKKGNGVVVIK